MGFGAVFIFRDVTAYVGYDMNGPLSGWEALGAGVGAVLIMCILLVNKLFPAEGRDKRR